MKILFIKIALLNFFSRAASGECIPLNFIPTGLIIFTLPLVCKRIEWCDNFHMIWPSYIPLIVLPVEICSSFVVILDAESKALCWNWSKKFRSASTPKKECKVFGIQIPVHHCNILSLAALLEGDLIGICCTWQYQVIHTSQMFPMPHAEHISSFYIILNHILSSFCLPFTSFNTKCFSAGATKVEKLIVGVICLWSLVCKCVNPPTCNIWRFVQRLWKTCS